MPLPERPIRVRSGWCADLLDQPRDLVLAAEEQAGILLAEGEQAAIGADRLAQGGAGDRLAADALEQQVELAGVVGVGAQVDPGLQLQEAAGRVGDLGQDDRDDREDAALALQLGLAVEGELDLAPLPGAEPGGADQHGDRTAAGDALLQGGEPGLAGGQLVAVEEGGEAGGLERRAQAQHRIRVGTAVAQKHVRRRQRAGQRRRGGMLVKLAHGAGGSFHRSREG